ncbi:SIS domain-containing protein [Chloroflexus sp.]|uniref:D-sedoheptulose-7-phosphate isomerase n=1 Tax=Chloroflexus sp. TaxID=1904827 RepID=UPI00298F1AC8|nr:SIS domain-containing protein [Chloroflexus sp.]MDW8405327.1 SIS domain-containing protein [Chloroflexus sp.]
MSFQPQLDEAIAVLQASVALTPAIDEITALAADALLAGHTLYTAGNGGSAADALHLAEELIGRYRGNRRPLAAICLNADTGALTCIANDFGYDEVFARQLAALGKPGDVLVVFSTSGNSPNILNVLRTARAKGVISIALLGKDGGTARTLADHALIVPSNNTARIQEVHTLILHAICEEVEQRLANVAAGM